MKKLALLTMMLLGTTSIASADSFRISGSVRGSVSYGAPRYQAPSARPQMVRVRDHRTNQYWDVTPVRDASFNVSGYYTGPVGNVTLTQRGNRITGTFTDGGQIYGVIENGKITYTWTQDEFMGRGVWYVAGRGQLVGTWGTAGTNSDSTGGAWNVTLAHR